MTTRPTGSGALRVATLVALVSCGGEAITDAGRAPPIVLPDAGPIGIAPPSGAMTPVWACPPGWSEVVVGDARGCEPWPVDFVGCGGSEARFVGDAACAPWAPCPADEWAADLPATGVLYVRAGERGGDGSRAAPFGAIAEAVAAAVDGDTVAIAPGAYDEAIRIDAAIALRGACPARTELRTVTPVAGVGGTIQIVSRGVTVSGLTIGGDRFGVDVRSGGQLTLRDVRVDRARTFGVAASEGAQVTLERVIVQAVPTGTVGAQVVAASGAMLTLDHVIVQDGPRFGVIAFNDESELVMRDTVVRRITPGEDRMFGVPVTIGAGSSIDAERLLVERGHAVGVIIDGAAAGGTLRDAVVRRMAPQESDGRTGLGVSVIGGATATIERALLSNNVATALFVGSASATVTARDVLVVGTTAVPASDDVAAAITLTSNAVLDLQRAHLEANTFLGISVDFFSRLDGEDVAVHRVVPNARGEGGRGLNATRGSEVRIERLTIEDAAESAILAQGDETTLTLRDLQITRVASRASDGRAGRGLTVIGGAHADIERATVSDSREVGVLVFGVGSEATLTDVVVQDTQREACEAMTCAGFGGGTAFAVIDDAHLGLDGFVARRSALAGLQIARASTIDLTRGFVADNVIGVNVQEVDFDLAILTRGVLYSRNGVNLDATELPLPSSVL